MPEAYEKFDHKKIPSVDNLKAPAIKATVIALLVRLDKVKADKEKLEIEEDDLKTELEVIQEKVGWTGFRHEQFCFYASRVAGRKTLDKMLLLENGCPASVLNASYKEGQPSMRRTFKRLEEGEAA